MKKLILLTLLLTACGGGGGGGGGVIGPPAIPSASNDPLSNLWYYKYFMQNAPINNGVQVLVVDTGFLDTHPDLNGQFVDLIDRNGMNDTSDQDGHGTITSGVIGMIKNNAIGGYGTYDKVELIGYKALYEICNPDCVEYVDLDTAVYYAADNNIEVVSISWSGCCILPQHITAAEYAFDRGTTVVWAAGNDGTEMTAPNYIDSNNMIVVGAVFEDFLDRAGFSNYGDPIDIMGPAKVTSTNRLGSYSSVAGTSVAAPYVAGIIARKYVELNPPLTHVGAEMVRNAVFTDALPLGDPYEYGHGLARVQ